MTRSLLQLVEEGWTVLEIQDDFSDFLLQNAAATPTPTEREQFVVSFRTRILNSIQNKAKGVAGSRDTTATERIRNVSQGQRSKAGRSPNE